MRRQERLGPSAEDEAFLNLARAEVNAMANLLVPYDELKALENVTAGQTLQSIGDEYGKTREWARQKRNKAIRRLHHPAARSAFEWLWELVSRRP